MYDQEEAGTYHDVVGALSSGGEERMEFANDVC